MYDQHGRIHGGSPEHVIEGAAQMAVTLLADNQDVILMARSRDLVRELSRRVRDELTRLGVIDPGPSVPLAAGARASVNDLIINRRNDHKSGLANGDVVRIEEITSDGEVLIRKATGRDPVTGEPVFTRKTIARRSLREFDSAYARTAHTTQGSQGTVGIPVATGDEDRQWLYSAMTRGERENHVFVMTSSPHQSDPAAGPAAAPEIGRYDRLQRFRGGRAAIEHARDGQDGDGQDPGHREAVDVLADVIARDGTEMSATEYRRRQLANADHLALLDTMWQDATTGPRAERYRQILADVVPPGYAAGADKSPKATWLWRTLRAVEAAGLDTREVMQSAVASRPLAGARDVAAIIDDRIRKQAHVDRLVPLPQGRWSDQVPQVDDPAQQKYLGQLAAAMDGRAERLGKFTADQQPQWAVDALGPVPADPAERARWERTAAPVAAYRELYGWDHSSEPVGPEPTMATPEKRAAWHAAAQALGRPADGPDLRSRDTGSLWLMRDTYEAETAWAPRFVSPELRAVRVGAQQAELTRARAAAEVRAAQARDDHRQAERQRSLAASAETLRGWYEARTGELEQADEDYRDWEHATEGSRRLAADADAELRRREPGLALPPLQTAEPTPVTDTERAELGRMPEGGRKHQTPEWVRQLAQARPGVP